MTVGRWFTIAFTSLISLRYAANSMAETDRRVNALLRRCLSEYRSQGEKPLKTCQQQIGFDGALFKGGQRVTHATVRRARNARRRVFLPAIDVEAGLPSRDNRRRSL